MKKLFVMAIAVACVTMLAAQVNAQDQFELSFGLANILDAAANDSNAGDGLVLLVVDTHTNGLVTADLTTGINISVGQYLNGSDDYIAAADNYSGGQDGDSLAVNMNLGKSLCITGQVYGIIWFPGLSTANGTLAMTTEGKYGSTELASPAQGDAWAIPLPGQLVTLAMYTQGSGADGPWDDDSAGEALYNVVPEPSTVVLVGLGVLGMLGITRRRSH